jgi:hypothetical protein
MDATVTLWNVEGDPHHPERLEPQQPIGWALPPTRYVADASEQVVHDDWARPRCDIDVGGEHGRSTRRRRLVERGGAACFSLGDVDQAREFGFSPCSRCLARQGQRSFHPSRSATRR